MVRRHGYIPHRPGLPTVHDVNGGELPLVEVEIKHAAHLAGVLHAKGGERVVLFRCDGLPVREQLDEQIRRGAFLRSDIAAQLFRGIQQFLTGGGLEVPLLPVLYHMVGGVGAGCFFLCAPRGILRVNFGTDAFVFLLRELVAQLIQYILQMFLQGFILEMLFNGILPSPVDPQCDVYMICHLTHHSFCQWAAPTRRGAPPAAAASQVLPDGGDGQRAPRGCPDTPAPAPAPRIHKGI